MSSNLAKSVIDTFRSIVSSHERCIGSEVSGEGGLPLFWADDRECVRRLEYEFIDEHGTAEETVIINCRVSTREVSFSDKPPADIIRDGFRRAFGGGAE